MDKENNKVQIKLERHRWPDEIAKEKKKRRIIFTTVCAMLVAFFLGWQASNLIGSNGTSLTNNNSSDKFTRVYQDIVKNWYFTRDMDNPESEIIDNAIKGMLTQNGDKHTVYMTEEEAIKLNDSINMSFVGIGVQYFEGENANVITDVFKNSPAEKAGIQAGDVLTKVNGQVISDADQSAKDLILGEEGTEVTVDVVRNGAVHTFTMTRAKVNALASGKMLNDDTAYLEITSFGMELANITEEYLKDFKANNAQKLIIDLRNNGGGYLESIKDIARLFLENGKVVYQEQFTNGKKEVYTVSGSVSDQYKFNDIVILINQNSASAAEVLTLALSENLDVTTVGVTSYGKGTVQVQRVYGDKSSLKMTIAEWMGPTGTSINGTGITPDHVVRLDEIFYMNYPNIDDKVIAPDSVDEGVSYVQNGLAYLGFHTGRVDGYYDEATRLSLNAYLTSLGLDAHANIDQATIKQVYSSVVSDWALQKSERDVQLHKALEVLK